MTADPTLARWRLMPRQLRGALRGLSPRQLKLRGGSEEWTVREYAHHVVEANLVACTIVIAAIAHPDCTYDWSWLIPDSGWITALGYERLPLDPALKLLDALSAHVANLIELSPGHMRRHLYRLGTKGFRDRVTVKTVLAEEVAHAKHHLADIAATRALDRSRPTRRRLPR